MGGNTKKVKSLLASLFILNLIIIVLSYLKSDYIKVKYKIKSLLVQECTHLLKGWKYIRKLGKIVYLKVKLYNFGQMVIDL